MADKDLYGVLGVSRDAETNEIRKAFLKLSKVHHPDKGGDMEKFKEIQEAHEVLTDERKRQVYDMTGSVNGEAPQTHNPFGQNGVPFDLGSMFGGMFGGSPFGMPGHGHGHGQGPRQRQRRPKAPPKIHEIPLRLSDYYHGRVFQVNSTRQKFCETCKGEGATTFQSCGMCQGRGSVRQIMQMGPMQVINEGPCGDCQGQGRRPSGSCSGCSGAKFKNQEKSLEVKIKPGMKPGDVIVFQNECSDDPNYDEPGDIHFILQEASGDEGWIRKGDDLETSLTITFVESLLGCSKQLKGHPGYPDGLGLTIPPISLNSEVLKLSDKGMIRKDGSIGVLYCRLQVIVGPQDRELLIKNKPLVEVIFGAAVSNGQGQTSQDSPQVSTLRSFP